MLPLVCYDRLDKPEGLWTSKLSGQFVEGEPTVTKFFVEGHVEIKELGGHLKAFFREVKLIVRGVQQFDKKKKKNGDGEDDDDEEEDEESSGSEKEDGEEEKDGEGEKQDIGKIPKLHIFMTTKKPKKRMVDAHKVGSQIKLSGIPDGVFGSDKNTSEYEAAIVNVADIFAYQGIVVLKLPQDDPVTEEPIIYGFVKLHSYRSVQIRTIEALHLNDLNDMLNKLTSLEEIGSASLALSSHSKKLIKPLGFYRKLAQKTWSKFGKADDDLITFEELLKLLDILDLFFLTVQAKRLFDVVDLKKTGKIGLIDFENYLIAKDLLHEVAKEIQLLDVYDSLKTEPIDEDYVLQKLEGLLQLLEIQEQDRKKIEAMEAMQQAAGVSSPQRVASPTNVPGEEKKAGEGENKLATANNNNNNGVVVIPGLNKAFIPKVNLLDVVAKRRKFLQTAKKTTKNKKIPLGLDYSGFLEAIQILGYRKKLNEDEDEESMIKAAFCYGGGIKEKDLDVKYLTLDEFRKAYIKVCNLEDEFKKRNLKLENSLFSDDRNRERLLRATLDAEDLYLNNLSKVIVYIENMKSESRQRHDNHKREKQLLKEKLLHDANKFIAQRAQDKRLQLKREQEEKSKKRLEDKVLKNKLLLRQQENQMMKRLEIAKANEEKEKLKLSEIKALGYDILDLSVKHIREIPYTIYGDKEAQGRLNYVNLLDLSHNILEFLPTKDFFFWLSETRKCKLSQNRLKYLPDDFLAMTKLEILELDTNKLEFLPKDFGLNFKLLSRLNLSNNHLTELPLGIGQCVSLKYLNLHSNHLKSLPNSLGACFQLEYLDCSNNLLRELPDDLQFLVALIHLDLNHNEISQLPPYIGNCMKLTYIDISINLLSAIPESFSQLKNLEYINMENNSIVISQHCYANLMNVKSFILKRNSIRTLSSDFGGLINLMFLDLSINELIALPIEIGLLKYLQKLNLHRNQLTTLPLEIGSCKSLQNIDLSYNNIVGMLPETMGIIYSLIELNISFNEINELPEAIVGFQEMKVLNAERCQLWKLPKTILTLDILVELNLPNNRFTLFPIELSAMKSLKKLNLYNNAITLLPRNINDICRLELDSLNLGKNQLKALPVEFTELLESIPEVILNENPWNYLPAKWGKRREGKESSDSILGYNLPDALDFLYAMRIIYNTCEQVWEELGVFFYANRLTIQDWIQEIKNRIPKSWHDGLVIYAEHIFYQSKETGLFVRWYLLTEEQEAKIVRKKKFQNEKKEKNMQYTKELHEKREKTFHEVYNNSIDTYQRLIQKTADRIYETNKNERYYQVLAQEQLHTIIQKEEKVFEKRHDRREKILENRKKHEIHRLKEILSYDKKEWEEEKEMIKRLRKLQEQEQEYVESHGATNLSELMESGVLEEEGVHFPRTKKELEAYLLKSQVIEPPSSPPLTNRKLSGTSSKPQTAAGGTTSRSGGRENKSGGGGAKDRKDTKLSSSLPHLPSPALKK